MGIYLNEGERRAAAARIEPPLASWGLGHFLGPQAGIALPGTQSLWSHWTRSRPAPASVKVTPVGSAVSSAVGEASPQPQILSEARRCSGQRWELRSESRTPGLGPGPREKLRGALQREDPSQCRLELGGPCPVSSPTSLAPRQTALPVPAIGVSGPSALSPQGKKDIYEINGNLCK